MNTRKELLDDLKYSMIPAERMMWLKERSHDLDVLRGMWKECVLLETPIKWKEDDKNYLIGIFKKHDMTPPPEEFWNEPQVKGIDKSSFKYAIEREAKSIKNEIEDFELYPQLKKDKKTEQKSLI
jgi:hypothetical protein